MVYSIQEKSKADDEMFIYARKMAATAARQAATTELPTVVADP